ncbi:hypothetical protein COCCADRAFT_97914, partial [Bipolaris zeicola 26-R-13]
SRDPLPRTTMRMPKQSWCLVAQPVKQGWVQRLSTMGSWLTVLTRMTFLSLKET